MSTRSTRQFPSTSEARCPDCGATLSRRSDLKRHRKTQHPDGTEIKVHCPYTGCKYKADQKSNLKAHIDARHSNELRYSCSDCGKGFTDPAARIRHRKRAHGYRPYHTPQYIAKQALKEAEQKSGRVESNETPDQRAASVSYNIQNASSLAATLSNTLTNATYHNDFWKLIVDAPRLHASEPNDSQHVQISVPVAAAPACGAPKTLHSDSGLSSPEVGQPQPSTTRTGDGTYLLGSQLDTAVQPQSHTQSWTSFSHTTPVAASGHLPLAAAFPTSDGQSTYPGMGFQGLPAFSFTDVIRPGQTFPTAPSAPSSSRVSGHQFVPLNHMATSPLEQVPGLGWTQSPTPANSMPLSQPDFFTGEPVWGFNSWCQSHNFA